ncbi:site-specific integrase [Onishia niordana]|uniref:site-specific integrase n=1 Tax=Onishia niordana TaxID=2508711 RepID=UPI00109F76B6|nr:site-specific integrase [Halomonas niordiana]
MPVYRVLRTEGDYPFHVVDRDGLPHPELTLYACLSVRYHSSLTARAYTREVVSLASWSADHPVVLRQGWQLLGPPKQVRTLLNFFLTSEMKCIVSLGLDRCGFETRRIEPTWQTGRRLERLLAALRSFYTVLNEHGRYHYENPMDADDARRYIEEERHRKLQEFVDCHGRLPMPADSGVDGIREMRLSYNYFRLKGDQWLPEILDEPALMGKVMSAGEKWGWTLREICLSRILFETGCRIHEACQLSVSDWVHSGFMREILSISKGSHGRRVKSLFISDRTVKILRQYVDEQRARLNIQGYGLSELAELPVETLRHLPLFLTRRGTSLSPDHFRRNYWGPALNAAGLQLRCHQVRHWFVTQALNEIHQRAGSAEELQTLRSSLFELMAWKSDMLPVYDQAMRRHDLPELAHRIHAHIEREQQHNRALRSHLAPRPEMVTESQRMLEEMLKP